MFLRKTVKNPAKKRKTTTRRVRTRPLKGRKPMAGRKRTTRKRTARKRTATRAYRKAPRRRNIMGSRRRTYMPKRGNPTRKRRTRRNATAGSRHRLTVYKRGRRLYAPRGPRAEELAMLSPGTRINKRRKRRRSNPRRSGIVKSLTNRKTLMTGLKIGGGITGGFIAMPLVYSILPVAFRQTNRRWLGLGHVGLGALMVGMLRNRDAKDVGMVVAGTGIYDLIANNVPQLGLPPLPTAMPEMFGGGQALLDEPESTSASYPVLSAPVSDVARRGIGASYEQSYSRAGTGLLGSNYEEPDEIEEMFSDY